MNNFVFSTLIGATAAATGPLRQNTWPTFGSTTDPVTTGSTPTKDAQDNVLEAYSLKGTVKLGPHRAFRNNLYIFPTQKVVKATTTLAADKATIASQAGTTQTFWAVASAKLGAYFGPVVTTDSSTIGNTCADAAGFVVCADTSAYSKCNGGAGVNFKAAATSHLIPSRLVLKSNTIGGMKVALTSYPTIRYNEDIVMASFYHEAWPSTTVVDDGTAWCSPFKTTLNADGTKSTITASNGFFGGSKCTWQLVSPSGSQAPGFMMQSAAYTNFVIQWTEFITVAALGTNAVLPTADGANYYIGAYDSSKGTFMNPMSSGISGDATWTSSSLSYQYNEEPNRRPAGSLGDCVYFPLADGPFKDTYILTTDSYNLVQRAKDIKKQNDVYEKAKKAYKREAKNYEDAGLKEQNRREDFFKNIFEATVTIPKRPNVPNFPYKGEFDGPDLNPGLAIGSDAKEWVDSAVTMGNTSYLKNLYGTNGNSPDDKFATRNGYLVSSVDTSVTDITKVVDGIGHSFGWLGQGPDSTPRNTLPFYWGTPQNSNTPTMQVAFFPEVDADTGLDSSAKLIKFDASVQSFMSANYYETPKLPSRAQVTKFFNPRTGKLENESAAAYMVVGTTAALALVATLF